MTLITSGVKLYIHLLNVVVQFIVFLTLSTLICRSTDISKCFSESIGIRDNESRLYSVKVYFVAHKKFDRNKCMSSPLQSKLHSDGYIYCIVNIIIPHEYS